MAGHSFKQLVFEQFFPDAVPLPDPEPTATTSPAPPAPTNDTEQPEQEAKPKMSGHSFKKLVFEQFFPESVPLPNPEPIMTTSPVPLAPTNDTEQPEQEVNAPEPAFSWADEVEEELGEEQPAPVVVPVPAAEDDIEDTAEKDHVQVTTIPLPDEATPAATDVAQPESDFPELESPGSELAEYEHEDGYESCVEDYDESCTLSQGSDDDKKKLSPIPEETESEGSHDNLILVDNPDEPVEPKGGDQGDIQSTELQEESSQMVPEDPTAPEMPTDSSPPQLGPDSFPPLYVTPGRTRLATIPGPSGGVTPLSAGEGPSVETESHGNTVPELAQEDLADDESEDDGYIVIGNDD
ncbi:hypothetical protein N0V85_004550 [Neurospora sp. IMI 360204]|nr:hypothetical protein N0V85_004550 [Neurospora sp. IMI 360204]